MKQYKKIKIYTILTFATALIAIGCSKNFLDEKPLSIYTPENTYNTADGLMAAVQAAGKNEWYENDCPAATSVNYYQAQLIFSDIAVSGATDNTQSKNYTATLTPDATDLTSWYWGQVYAGIKYANIVITYIDQPKWDTTQASQQAQRNEILGMGYFWRAFYYYYLVNCYGDVPWVGELTLTPKVDFYSASRTAILKKIQSNLEYAAQWVPDGTDKGLPTKGAVLHLLTKVDLALNDFDDAVTAASQVINGGVYHLMTSRFGSSASDNSKNVIYDLHQAANKSIPANTEGMLMVINRENINGNIGAQQLIRFAGPYWGHNIVTPNGNAGTNDAVGIAIDQNSMYGRGIGLARGTWYSTHTIWDNVNSTGDYRYAEGTWMRMTDFVYNNPAIKGNDDYYGKPLQEYSANGTLLVSDTIRSWFDYPGYKIFVYDPNTATSTQAGGYSDAYIFRLAETYLLRAEAYVWKGDNADALTDINTVRARANAPLLTGQVDIGTILDERARELSFEEERKIELTRMAYTFAQTGKMAPTGKAYNTADFSTSNFWYDWIMSKTDFYNKGVKTGLGIPYTISPYMVLWPVPSSAISGNTGGVINQNAGYSGYANNKPPLDSIP